MGSLWKNLGLSEPWSVDLPLSLRKPDISRIRLRVKSDRQSLHDAQQEYPDILEATP